MNQTGDRQFVVCYGLLRYGKFLEAASCMSKNSALTCLIINSFKRIKMNKIYIFALLCLFGTFSKTTCEVEKENFDDVPFIEGNRITITTAVEDDVLILTRENFNIQVSSKDIILVEFYAPWCGHCISLAPEYAKAAKILKDSDPPIPLAKVDATVETELASRYEVTGYPTLYIFRKGQKFPYEGPRTAMGIIEHMKERSDPNWKPPPETVLTLTSENFTETIENADIILVEFYAPWCGHCKTLAPEYERAAKVLKHLPTPISVAKIDGTTEKELADKYEARGWPTLMIFRKGLKFAYEGPRNEPGIIQYMKEQAKPPSQEVKSVKQIENVLGKIDSTIAGFFSSESDPFYEKFLESANGLRGKFNFLHTFNRKVMKLYKLEKSSVVLFQPVIYASEFEPTRFVLNEEDSSADKITKFVNDNFIPLVGERSQRSRWKYENKYPLVVVYYDVDFSFDHRAQTQLIRKEVIKVAKDYKRKITFAVSNEGDYEDDMIQLNLVDSGENVNVGFFESAKIRFRMEPVEDFSADELRSFVEDVLSGNVPMEIKSQPVPKDMKSPIITVVGSTFDKIVTKNYKDVLIEFYAPWCGHCKKLEPIFKKLGKTFADYENVVIAKMDASANDYPSEFVVNGFPTIYYVPAKDKKNILSYDGDRSLEDLTKFVKKQLSADMTKDEL